MTDQNNQNWNQSNIQPQAGVQPNPNYGAGQPAVNQPQANQWQQPMGNQAGQQWQSNPAGQNTGMPQYQQTQVQPPYQGEPMPGYQAGVPTEASYQNYGMDQRYAQSMPGGQLPPQKKSRIGLWIGLAVVLLLVIGLGTMYGMGVFKGKSNAEKLLEAMMQGSQLTQVEAYQEIAIDELVMPDGYGMDMISELLKDAKLKVHSKADVPNSKVEMDVRLEMKDVEMLDLFYQQMNEELIISIPKLLSSSIYFSKDSLSEMLEENNVPDADTVDTVMDNFSLAKAEAAMKYLKPAFNPTTLKSFKTLEKKKKYLSRILDYMNEHITAEKGSQTIKIDGQEKEFKGQVYTFSDNLGDFSEFYFEILLELLEDENFKPFVEEYLDRIIATVEKNKDVFLYNYLVLIQSSGRSPELKDEWDEDIISELTYIKEIILDGMEEAIENISPSLNTESKKVFSALKKSGSKFKLTFVVDKIIKYSDVKLELNPKKIAEALNERFDSSMFESLQYRMTSALLATGGDVKFEKFDKDNAIDLAKADEEDLYEMMEELQINIGDIVQSMGLF
ncbi:hypothetical protein EII17_06480 [Clostridiales bacterium COT073_COT-073]|nr:hypothetical protein EII17_06480 [Clostridiales bacterium COT073_COT-073]